VAPRQFAFGTALRGIKDSETRMRSLGYNVPLHLFLVFTISGSSPASPVRFMRCSTISSARALWRSANRWKVS